MRRRIVLAVVVAALALTGCSDDGDTIETGDTSPTTTPDTDSTVADTDPTSTTVDAAGSPSPDSIVLIEVPETGFDALDVDDRDWFAQLHQVASESGSGYLGTGTSPEPATVIDPDASITANQTLAAAHGVASDLYGASGEAEVVVQEETAIDPGRPAWHVRLRFNDAQPAVDVDLVGFEDNGEFHFAFAALQGLDSAAAEPLFAAVAAATTG